jgi:hypothetical protein
MLVEKKDVFGLWRSGVFLEVLAKFNGSDEKEEFFGDFGVSELKDTIDVGVEEIDKWRMRSEQLEQFLGAAQGWLRNRKEWSVVFKDKVIEFPDYESSSKIVESGSLTGTGRLDGSCRSPLSRTIGSPLCSGLKLIEQTPTIVEELSEVHNLGTNYTGEGEDPPENTIDKEHKFTKKLKTTNYSLRIISPEETSSSPSRRRLTHDVSGIINTAKPVHSYKKVENFSERAPSLENVQETLRPIETTKNQTSQDDTKGVKNYLT